MAQPELVVQTSLGAIGGTLSKGVYSYKGIQYAHSLNATNRFSRPLPTTGWDGVLDATSYGPICPQKSLLRKRMGEDSLRLNIWTPQREGELLPVLFYIHGGSFKQGSGSESLYEGSALADKGEMVVVTTNYRLNIWGFCSFSSLDPSCRGNNGLADVLLGLSWVQRHIRHFGGDPLRVTIMGQSAGGTMVSLLYTMDSARNLFSQAIVLSGGPTQVQGKKECMETSDAFLQFANIGSREQLKGLSTKDLVDLQHKFTKKYSLGAATYRLTLDGDLVDAHPIPAAIAGKGGDKPLLIGTTGEEMGFMAVKPLANLFNLNHLIEKSIALEGEQLKRELTEAYVSCYGEKRVRSCMYTDLLFRMSSIWFAQASSEYSPTWMYRFDFETKALEMQGMHAVHSSDLPYVFGNLENRLVKPMFLLDRDMDPIYAVADELQGDLIRFVHTGSLPWQKVGKNSIIAKRYDEESTIGPMVDPSIEQLYRKTLYYERSIKGLGTFKVED